MDRPKLTPEMVEQAVQSMAKRGNWTAGQASEIAQVVRTPIDGYHLAKSLEDRFGWDISVDDVEELHGVWDAVRDVHKAACFAWVKEFDIQPPYPIGTMTTRGEITGIYPHDAACYEIREPDDTSENQRLIVKFEGVKVVATENGKAA